MLWDKTCSEPSEADNLRRPSVAIAELAEQNPRWRKLLRNSDGLFSGGEVISRAYEDYLLDVLDVMEKRGCTLKQAITLSAASNEPNSPSEIGVLDFLRMRRAGRPLHEALIYNLKARNVGPARAEICSWRRKEAREALKRGALAAKLAETTFSRGLNCTEEELSAAEANLAEARALCFGLGNALEILEANSRACNEGQDVLNEYKELMADAALCNQRLNRCAKEVADLRERTWSIEYLVLIAKSLILPVTGRTRCCGCSGPSSSGCSLSSKALCIEVLASVDLSPSEARLTRSTLNLEGDDEQSKSFMDTESDREVYLEAELGDSKRRVDLSPQLDDLREVKRSMIFAFAGEQTVHVQVFEEHPKTIETIINGDPLIGEAYLLLDLATDTSKPRGAELQLKRQEKVTGTVLLQYELAPY